LYVGDIRAAVISFYADKTYWQAAPLQALGLNTLSQRAGILEDEDDDEYEDD
jgi:hypothetical protein